GERQVEPVEQTNTDHRGQGQPRRDRVDRLIGALVDEHEWVEADVGEEADHRRQVADDLALPDHDEIARAAEGRNTWASKRPSSARAARWATSAEIATRKAVTRLMPPPYSVNSKLFSSVPCPGESSIIIPNDRCPTRAPSLTFTGGVAPLSL